MNSILFAQHWSPPFVSYSRRALRLLWASCAVAGLTLSGSCSDVNKQGQSSVKVTDIPHTAVKRQSINNCWLYGEATWLESLLKAYNHTDLNVSESYWTWWHWHDQLVRPNFRGKEIETGGSWREARSLIMRHGWVLAGEFIPTDATSEMSQKQREALKLVNKEIGRGGRLSSAAKRTPEAVRMVLDEAFSSNMAEVDRLARPAAQTIIGHDEKGSVSLADALAGAKERRWQFTPFPEDDTQRRETLVRVFRALNDYHPVVMDIDIDFNAMDLADNGSFKKSLLDAAGTPGKQGGHVVVLKDYLVENVPGYGTLGRGDLPSGQKAAALQGDLVALIAKNSWGVKRPDRGMIDGYTAFYKDYLYGPITWKPDEDNVEGSTELVTPLESFILPPGY